MHWTWGATGLGAALTLLVAFYYRTRAGEAPFSLGQGFPLDDAWIHAQFALNASRGAPFQYNLGDFSSGSTAPLWSLLEGAALWLVGDPLLAGHGLGVLFAVATSVGTVLLGRRMGLSGPALVATAALTAVQWRLSWASLSGMEIPLTCSLLVATFWVYLGARKQGGPIWHAGLLAGLLVWSRPEGILAIAVIALDQALLLLQPASSRAARYKLAKKALGIAAAWGAVTAPLFAMNATFGPGLLPQTVYAKAQVVPFERGLHLLGAFVIDLGADGRLWPIFIVGAAGWAAARSLVDWRRSAGQGALAHFGMTGLATIAFLKGSADYHMRYLMPLLPLITLFGVDGLCHAAGRLGRWASPGVLLTSAALAWAAGPSLVEGAETYALNVASVTGHVVEMGRWTARRVPRDAVLAMSDIGAMSYFTENPVIDMRGLISPDHGWDTLAELNRQRRERVTYAMLFPELNARVILAGDYLPIHVITLDANNISATDNLVVYRPPWADARRRRAVGRAFDFESGTRDGWSTRGVFDRGPVEGAGPGQRNVVNLGGGRWLLSSWGDGNGDGATGQALSPPFQLVGDIMTMRIGGGSRPGEIGLRLWVEGRIEETAVGPQSEVLVHREWDIRSLRGREARLELFDESTDGWGHVMLDEIRQWRVLGEGPPRLRGHPPEGPQEPRSLRRAAEARGYGESTIP